MLCNLHPKMVGCLINHRSFIAEPNRTKICQKDGNGMLYIMAVSVFQHFWILPPYFKKNIFLGKMATGRFKKSVTVLNICHFLIIWPTSFSFSMFGDDVLTFVVVEVPVSRRNGFHTRTKNQNPPIFGRSQIVRHSPSPILSWVWTPITWCTQQQAHDLCAALG